MYNKRQKLCNTSTVIAVKQFYEMQLKMIRLNLHCTMQTRCIITYNSKQFCSPQHTHTHCVRESIDIAGIRPNTVLFIFPFLVYHYHNTKHTPTTTYCTYQVFRDVKLVGRFQVFKPANRRKTMLWKPQISRLQLF